MFIWKRIDNKPLPLHGSCRPIAPQTSQYLKYKILDNIQIVHTDTKVESNSIHSIEETLSLSNIVHN